jgi:hypothetical protein
MDFLQRKSKSVTTATIKGYITAISNRHDLVKVGHKKLRLSHLTAVGTWLKGLIQSQGVPRTIVPTWNLEVVLSALKRAPYEPIETTDTKSITLKTVFLIAITSARRASEIYSMDSILIRFGSSTVTAFTGLGFKPKVNSNWHVNQPIELPALHLERDHALHKLCIRRSLNAYLKATQHLRKQPGCHQLFLCLGGKRKGKPVSKVRISQWLKKLIQDAYKTLGLPPPEGVKGHQVRKQATSWADMAGIDPQKICDAATWKSDSVFARHYHLDLVHGARSDLGRSVLRLGASSSAEAALPRRVGASVINTNDAAHD